VLVVALPDPAVPVLALGLLAGPVRRRIPAACSSG